MLARHQKVDLAKISILRLVEQYLAFIADAASSSWRSRPIISSWRRGWHI
jgi:chromatin segregation and condensation protein Rec8/ScpA/Scc1 (kleisin family)